MMVNHTFIIEDKSFAYQTDTAGLNQFLIKSTPRAYGVRWDQTENPLKTIDTLLQAQSNNLLLIDEAVLHAYGEVLTVEPHRIFKAPATENFKTLEGVGAVFDFLHDRQFTKAENLLVVGGGIIQDVGGFVGAAYKRGIRWTYVPSTLLSMCDSCIGSKTGINYRNVKNQIAVFSAPSEIIINPHFLSTLPLDAILSGLGEMLKYAIISGPASLQFYQRYVKAGSVTDWNDFKALINHALSIKKSIIEEDEFELNYRRSLNYGHTFGHALEVLSDYAIPHGIAVVIGMMLANEMSNKLKLLSDEDKKQLSGLCKALVPRAMRKQLQMFTVQDLLDLLKKDKKALSNEINFIVPKQPGHLMFLKCQFDDVLRQRLDEIMRTVFAELNEH